MNIISWNANRVGRYAMLWAEPEVTANQWDIICLQESGNPDPTWTYVSGPVWTGQSTISGMRDSVVIRFYTTQPPGLPPIYITHGEWPDRQKNHLVIITKAMPSWAADLSGQAGERPALGIRVRLTFANGTQKQVLVGSLHIVANHKAPIEVAEMTAYFDAMMNHTHSNGWVVIGDFNCEPSKLAAIASTCSGAFPSFYTQGVPVANQTIDYFIFSPKDLLGDGQNHTWHRSVTTKSDHHLISYRNPGDTVAIL
jgi:hypothetical protein